MQRRRRYTNLKYSDTEWLYHRKLSLIKEEHFEKYQCLPKLWPDESLLSPLGNLSSFSDDFRYGSLCKPTWVKHIPMWMLWRLCEREIERWQPYLPDSDYCLTTISRKASKAGFPSVFNGLRNVRRTLTNLAVIRTMIKNTAFYQDTPENSDRRHCSCQALSLCKKARRKLMHLSLRLAFARTDCTPMTHCVPMGRNSWNFWAFRADIFWVQLDGAGYGNRTRLLGLGSRCTTDVLILHMNFLIARCAIYGNTPAARPPPCPCVCTFHRVLLL